MIELLKCYQSDLGHLPASCTKAVLPVTRHKPGSTRSRKPVVFFASAVAADHRGCNMLEHY